ncbi:MAG TPA: Rrf2 family transcriptional regulator, partial [Nitrospiria bacterium]|nr:Rrf2 family transcriptional regulator [Nitrospiria bacterium]
MKLSAKTEYGIQALLELASRNGDAPAQAKSIAQRQNIPYRFLEQVLNNLRKAGLIESIRGAQGGYTLA